MVLRWQQAGRRVITPQSEVAVRPEAAGEARIIAAAYAFRMTLRTVITVTLGMCAPSQTRRRDSGRH